jgi:hypothetical protein
MRISHQSKFIFLSKPKCATTSIRQVLDPFSDIKSSQDYPFHHHVKAFELKMCFENNDWPWNQYFKFITIRNPWEMIVSYYSFGKPDLNGNFWWQTHIYDKNHLVSFRDWVLYKRKSWHYLLPSKDGYLKNVFTDDFSSLTLNSYILDEYGRCLVDEVIKTEELNDGFQRVLKKLGLNIRNIPNLNETKHSFYQNYYDEQTAKVIEHEFKFDIVFGNYQF